MSGHPTIIAHVRVRAGKGSARAARREGKTPGVIYGGAKTPIPLIVAQGLLNAEIEKGGFLNRLYDVEVGGQLETVLPRDVQYHPVTDHPLHVDFLRVTENTSIAVNVLVKFEGEDEAPGIKRGGVLNVIRREVELTCRVSAIPEALTASLVGLDIGDSIRISGIELPEGTTPVIQRDFIIATITAPTIVQEEEVAETSDVEGEEAEAEESEPVDESEAEKGSD